MPYDPEIEDLLGPPPAKRPLEPPRKGRTGPCGELPEFVTADQLGALLGVNARSVSEAARRGDMVREGRSLYRLADSIRRYVASKGNRGKDFQAAKERLTTAQAVLAETKIAEARRELVPAREIEQAWATIVRDARAALLAVSSRVGQRLGHLTPGDLSVIDAEIREALTRLGDSDAE